MIYEFLRVSTSDQICKKVGCGPKEALERKLSIRSCRVARYERRTIILVIAMNARMKTM